MSQLYKLPRPLPGSDPALNQLVDVLERGDPWREMIYNQVTNGPVAITATTEATANTIVTADPLSCDGKPILIEFFSPRIERGTTRLIVYLYEDSTTLGDWGRTLSTEQEMYLVRRLVPTAGVHTYSVRAAVDAGTGNVYGEGGGSGKFAPLFIRISRA